MSEQGGAVVVLPSAAYAPVTQEGVDGLRRQRELLRVFVSEQLREASFGDPRSPSYGEGDYGVIPGTKKKCLFKQGAEKALKLFGLGVRFEQTDKELDRTGNFALYTYKAVVYVMNSGVAIAECEGTANSQEKKYKERTVWKTNAKGIRESVTEETPVCDVINTLQKMAQKRALVGAAILATGLSEYFTQDILEPEDIVAQQPGQKPAPRDVQSEVSSSAPQCCGGEMMVSKYVDQELGHAPWYCPKCKNKARRE